jgi:two-component system, LytTR family, response regulator
MKIIHVDDEKINLFRFQLELSKIESKHQLTPFENAQDAWEYVQISKPDIAFLDIEMQGKNGIWLARKLAQLSIPFAFVTAHQGYAIEAFSLSAIHYIVKPITAQSISDVLQRLEDIKAKTSPSDFSQQLQLLIKNELPATNYPKKILIKRRFKVDILNLENIMLFEASGSYTNIKMIDGQQHKSSNLLRIYEESLADHPGFLRIHRAFIVNKNCVAAILKNEKKNMIQLTDGTELEISPTLVYSILEILKL